MNDKTILRAEDNLCSAEMFVSMLRVCGIENEVILARDGVEANEPVPVRVAPP